MTKKCQVVALVEMFWGCVIVEMANEFTNPAASVGIGRIPYLPPAPTVPPRTSPAPESRPTTNPPQNSSRIRVPSQPSVPPRTLLPGYVRLVPDQEPRTPLGLVEAKTPEDCPSGRGRVCRPAATAPGQLTSPPVCHSHAEPPRRCTLAPAPKSSALVCNPIT
jgi:hypothetical protein